MWLLDLLFRYNSSIKSMEARRDIKGLARVLKYRRDPLRGPRRQGSLESLEIRAQSFLSCVA